MHFIRMNILHTVMNWHSNTYWIFRQWVSLTYLGKTTVRTYTTKRHENRLFIHSWKLRAIFEAFRNSHLMAQCSRITFHVNLLIAGWKGKITISLNSLFCGWKISSVNYNSALTWHRWKNQYWRVSFLNITCQKIACCCTSYN